MADNDLSTVAYIYKRRYSDRQTTEVATREHATLDQIAKESGFTGSAFYYPITYGNPQGISGTFTTAQSGAATLKGLQLAASRKKKYGVVTLDGEAIAAARGDKGAFYDLVTRVSDGILEEMGDSLAFDLFRDGNGIRGRGASISTNTITLSNPEDVRNFKVGMTVGASPNATGSSPRTGTTTIAALSRSAGTILLTSAAAITSLAGTDYLFRAGDVGTCMEGFDAATPLTAPTAGDSFRGVDRSVDVEALSGSRITSASIIEEDMGLCAVNISTLGKKVKMGCLYPTKFWQMVRRLNAKVEYQNGGGTANYGFEYVMIHTPAGSLKIFSEPDCPVDKFRLFNPEAHALKTLDEMVHVIRDDGRPSLRSTGADSIEVRVRSMLNYIQYDTSAHGVGSC
jgi:hypothetical protein